MPALIVPLAMAILLTVASIIAALPGEEGESAWMNAAIFLWVANGLLFVVAFIAIVAVDYKLVGREQ